MSDEPIEDGGAVEQTPAISDRLNEFTERESFVAVAAVVAVALVPWLLVDAPVLSEIIQGYRGLPSLIMIFGIVVLGFNLLLGYIRLISFGHAAFFGGAAYAAGIFSDAVLGSPLAMVVVGTVVATLLAWIIGYLSIRRGGVYFAVLTLTFGQMLYYLALGPAKALTNGDNGFTSVQLNPVLGVFELEHALPLVGNWMYVLAGGFAVLAIVAVNRIVNSPYGLIFRAIGQNEQRVEFLGLHVWRYKLMAFILSGTFAGIGGSLFTIHEVYVPLGSLYWVQSGDFIIMTVLGGLGSLVGPVLGAAVFLYIENVVSGFAGLGSYWLLILGIVFATVVWLFPEGLWGIIKTGVGRISNRGED